VALNQEKPCKNVPNRRFLLSRQFASSDWSGPKFENSIQEAFEKYRETLTDDRKALLDHYEIKDIAAKVVGVGSVGTRCGILLLMADTDDHLILQVKEARASVL
jgi:uncharacterized protein (DUF2252 family)